MPWTSPKNCVWTTYPPALEVSQDSVSFALGLLQSAGRVTTRKQVPVVHNCVANSFPEPLRDTCLRRLVAMTHTDD